MLFENLYCIWSFIKCFIIAVQTTLELGDLKSGDYIDEWYSLQPVNVASRGDMGSIRIKARYLHEVIMPPEEYTTLKEVRKTWEFWFCIFTI